MSWLLLAAITAGSSVSILALANAYLYLFFKERFIKAWTIAWGIFALRYLFLVVGLLWRESVLLEASYHLCIIAGAVVLLNGTLQFVGKPSTKWPAVTGAILALWTVVSLGLGLRANYFIVPVFSFLSITYLCIGRQILKHARRGEIGGRTVGWLFILWGVHQADYPMLRPVAWFAPWGFLLGSLLALSIAIGMILVYFERTHRELRDKEERHRNLIESSHDWIWEIDARGRYTYASQLIGELLGYAPEEVLGKTPFDLMAEAEVSRVRRSFAEIWAKRAPFKDVEKINRHRNGGSVAMETSGVPFFDGKGIFLGYRGTDRDVTERKRGEAVLRESEFFFKESQRSASIGSYKADLAAGRWESSEVMDAIFGIGGQYRRDIAGWLALVHPDDRAMLGRYLEEEVIAGKKFFSKEYRIVRKNDGETRWVYGLGEVALDADGKVSTLMGTIQDVTERKRAEEERDQLERQLLHAQKMDSLGILAGGVAHDFNNILVSIVGNADLALLRIAKESPAVENIRKIEQAAARAADLAKQMLAYSGRGKFVFQHLDLNLLLEEMLSMLEVSISKKAALRLNLHPALPAVGADATQLRQIVMNLTINASEAIGDGGGIITITTNCMDCRRSYLKDVWLNETLEEGRYVYLEIADSGCGMSGETQAKIFDPFFTTKFTGRGLGMAAVLGIVRGHKGAIKVYSELGKGTSFKILLPASDSPADVARQDDGGDRWRGYGKVLLVDDEEMVRDIGCEMLKELGFTTITANDGEEAVEIFQSIPDIRYVVLDLTMPTMDGEQCFRHLKLLKPEVTVIMSSGYNEQEVSQKFMGKGIAGFVQKPYTVGMLKDAFRSLPA